MADTGESSDCTPSSQHPPQSKVVRSQKIVLPSNAVKPGSYYEESDESTDYIPPRRSHTPGHLAHSNTTRGKQRQISDVSLRQRSQSTSQVSSPTSSHPSTYFDHTGSRNGATAGSAIENIGGPIVSTANPVASPTIVRGGGGGGAESTADESERQASNKRPSAMRSASSLASRSSPSQSRRDNKTPTDRKPSAKPYTPFPTLPAAAEKKDNDNDEDDDDDDDDEDDVPPAPASGMYWSKAPVSGAAHTALRAHTTTIIGSNIYVFGGCDSRTCFKELYVFDADSFHWSVPHTVGTAPVPLRAMTCTAVGKKLVIFGGGDGPTYYNDVYVLDVVNFRWSKPRVLGDKFPSKRRAHTACLYKNGIYVFGGGDGVRALNDVWRLDVGDVGKMSWKLISGPERTVPGIPREVRPKPRGYHTSNMVGSKLIVFGGSDGGECFDDVWVYDVEVHFWKRVPIPVAYRRLSHTATLVGSYLFIIGGHDGTEYSNDVLLLNLVTMTWDKRKTYGKPPEGRGYHGAVLYDSRLIIIGGFDGSEVYGDVMLLELAVHAYYSQISHFTVEV